MARLIFKHFGMDADKEVKFLALGTNERRFAAMKQGLAAATLGTPPPDFFGKKFGFVVLALVTSFSVIRRAACLRASKRSKNGRMRSSG